MKSGYYQVEVLEEYKCRTILTVGPLGFWEFNLFLKAPHYPDYPLRTREQRDSNYIVRPVFIVHK